MKILMLVIAFFLLGAFFIISNNDLSLAVKEDVQIFEEKYLAWMNKIYDNGLRASSYVIKSEWLPSN